MRPMSDILEICGSEEAANILKARIGSGVEFGAMVERRMMQIRRDMELNPQMDPVDLLDGVPAKMGQLAECRFWKEFFTDLARQEVSTMEEST